MDYSTVSKQVDIALRDSVSSYEHDLASKLKQNPKLFYSYVHQKQNTKESVRFLQDKDGEFVYDRVKMAEMLNDSFCSIFIFLKTFQRRKTGAQVSFFLWLTHNNI